MCAGRKSRRHMSGAKYKLKRAYEYVITLWNGLMALQSSQSCSVMPESQSQDNRTSPHSESRHGEHRKSLRKRWPMVTLCSKHKNDPSKAQIGQGQHPKWREASMHGTNLGILGVLFCVPGGIYRPQFLKLNLSMTARHYPGQWSMSRSLCPFESVTPKPCSWGSLLLYMLVALHYALEKH